MLVKKDSFRPSEVKNITSVISMSDAFYPERYNQTDLDDYLKLDVNVTSYSDWNKLLRHLRKLKGVVHIEPNSVYQLNLP